MTPTVNEELTWGNTPSKELLKISLPIAVSMLSYSAMTLVDTIFVGRLGTEALAGVGLAGVLAFTLTSFGYGLLRAVKILVSQARGAGQDEHIGPFIAAGLWVSMLLGFFWVFASRLIADPLSSLAAGVESGQAASLYFSIRMLASPFVLGFAATKEGRYGIGDTKSAMFSSIGANVVNIGLDYLFIVILEWGVAGAAWASVAASFVQFAMLAVFSGFHGWTYLAAGRKKIKSIIKIGVPTGFQFVLEMSSFLIVTMILAKISDLDMAAHQIVIQVIHFGFLPFVAVAEGASVMAGQAVGAGLFDWVGRVSKRAFVFVVIYGTLFASVLFLFPEFLSSLFTKDPELISISMTLMFIAGVFQIFDGVSIVSRGVLRGVGDVRTVAVIGVVLTWCTIPPLTWFLGKSCGLGAKGAWLGITAEVLVGSFIFSHRLLSKRWQGAARETLKELN